MQNPLLAITVQTATAIGLPTSNVVFYFAVFLGILSMHAKSAHAQLIEIKNPEMILTGTPEHGQPNTPKNWNVDSKLDDGLRAWDSPASPAIAIGTGAFIAQTVAIPPLTEKQSAQGKWGLVLAVDATGKFSTSDSPAEIKLSIAKPNSKTPIAEKSFPISNDAPKAKPSKRTTELAAPFTRLLLPITADQVDGAGKSLEFKISVDSKRYVIVDHVHVFRAPEKATMKMRGKANGHNGPDLLGAGSYGFQGLMIHKLPALPVIEVFKGSPAARAGLLDSDMIVGINDEFLPAGNVAPGYEWFENSHEALLGRAAVAAYKTSSISLSESTSSASSASSASADQNLSGLPVGVVRLNVLRAGELTTVDVKLKLPPEIANDNFMTNPKMFEPLNNDLIDHVVAHQQKNGSWKNNPIHTALGGLALLSTGDQRHAKRIVAAADWTMQTSAEPGTGFYWHPAFSGIFLAEYYLATGDERVIPVLERSVRMMSSTFHTSKWGTDTFGHGPRGLPYGNKSLVAVMVHVMVMEALTKRCGIESEIYETLEQYLMDSWSDPADGGHGAMGYNQSYKDKGEFWSRTGLFGLHLSLRDIRPDMLSPLAKIMHERHPWFRNSHAYGEPGGVLGLIGLSQMNSNYFDEVLSGYQWWFALAWETGHGLHFTIPHMGAPYMEGEELINSGYAIVTNIHRKSLHITGSEKRNWLKIPKVEHTVTEVMILQQPDGNVMLRCKIPGPDIYYTVDGSDPNPKSPVYRRPFLVKEGSIVKAIAASRNDQSKIASRQFSYDKSKWRVVSATGNQDDEKAKDRAKFSLDGDRLVPWTVDVGEGAPTYPHEIVIDMQEEKTIGNIEVHYVFELGAAKSIEVTGSNSATGEFETMVNQVASEYSATRSIPASSKQPFQYRYLKLKFSKPFKEDSPLLMVGEIDVR